MIIEYSKSMKELSRINKIHETRMRFYCLKYNPMLAFTSCTDDAVRNSIVRKYISTNNEREFMKSVKDFNSRFYCKWTKICRNNFMRFILNKNNIKYMFMNLIDKYNSYELANELNITQHSIRILCEENDIKISTHNSSKVHLRLKPIIENIIGYKTISEYYVNINGKKYFIDEYCKELSVAFEIDGSWCHNKIYDTERDKNLNSIGIKVIRIDSNISEDDLINLLKD